MNTFVNMLCFVSVNPLKLFPKFVPSRSFRTDEDLQIFGTSALSDNSNTIDDVPA